MEGYTEDTFMGISFSRPGNYGNMSQADKTMDASMDLMLRLPSSSIKKNLGAITELVPDDDLKGDIELKTDQPLDIIMDEDEGREFLKCEYNKDGDSYRSPWTNKYFPEIVIEEGEEEPIYPSGELREMEVKANAVFARYAKLYYDDNFFTTVTFFD